MTNLLVYITFQSLICMALAHLIDIEPQVSVSVKFRPLHPFKPIYISRLPDTIWTTTTATVRTTTMCAKLVNVTAACHRRRGFLIDEPIILTFDEDMEELDALLKPTESLSVETTEPPPTLREDRKFTSIRVVESSMSERTQRRKNSKSPIASDYSGPPAAASRLGFLPLLDHVKNKHEGAPSRVTITFTSTTYSYTSTKTFFIQNCIPQPFSYVICPGAKR